MRLSEEKECGTLAGQSLWDSKSQDLLWTWRDACSLPPNAQSQPYKKWWVSQWVEIIGHLWCLCLCMLIMWVGYLTFSNTHKLSCNWAVLELWASKYSLSSIDILSSISSSHCLVTLTSLSVLAHITRWLCITLVQKTSHFTTITSLTSSSSTLKNMHVTALMIFNVGNWLEKHID